MHDHRRTLGRYLALTLWLTGACSHDDSSAGEQPFNANYGEQSIGYKSGKPGKRESEQAEEGEASSGSPGDGDGDTADGDGDSGDGDIGDGDSGDGDGPPPGLDAGVVPVADGGPRDGGERADAGAAREQDAGSEADGGLQELVDGGLPLADELPAPLPEPAPAVLENPFFSVASEPTSTFALDADTGAYTLARAAIQAGRLPDASRVRIEEFLNYFHFHYAQPRGEVPFSLYTEMAPCPWNAQRKLVMLGVQGQEVKLADQPAANLVFLLDVSGSMDEPNKLPLLQKAFRMLAKQLRPQDRVSVVTYAGNESVLLEGVPGDHSEEILTAIDGLQAGGATNGEGGIQKAYALASEHFIAGGNNRVLLATDGDFNVGISDLGELVELIAQKRATGVFLSTYGFGSAWDGGNYEDETMEQLADNGNGIYFFIDSPEEARRAFLSTVSGSLLTVAKDVKIQVEFSPATVKAYRLIGYENRVLANQDFDNDTVDAGELGANLSMTALYEIIPAGSSEAVPQDVAGTAPVIVPATPVDDGAGQPVSEPKSTPVPSRDLLQLRVRYKGRDASTSELIATNYGSEIENAEPSPKLSFAAAVSEFAIGLRGSQYTTLRSTEALLADIDRAQELDTEGAIAEFRTLVEKAAALRATSN